MSNSMKRDLILGTARRIFASTGYEGLSMRTLATQLKMPQSVLYHYFSSKDNLLETVFHETNRALGQARRALPEVVSAADLLRQRIAFQFAHAEEVVAVLKYYLYFRSRFPKTAQGYLPEKSALHIEEVLEQGIASGEFEVADLKGTAKVIAHAINGFLLEYYPARVDSESLDSLVKEIADFILRALRPYNQSDITH